ncbi:hypothetical protein CPSG_00038 [Coccidioides posadasii str. Silveira]|uniref:Uncharacterized protein n=1 Tax=Coccidioides posadasii (strain RMSCC 757 / Silveira) TaxID=443226 RepID=E9CTJ4_COCPS|nr:hypothetical protein CPSG_00038 [Coccidioides posadasii str. Silveira]
MHHPAITLKKWTGFCPFTSLCTLTPLDKLRARRATAMQTLQYYFKLSDAVILNAASGIRAMASIYKWHTCPLPSFKYILRVPKIDVCEKMKRASIPTSTVRVPAFRRHPSAETPSQELI